MNQELFKFGGVIISNLDKSSDNIQMSRVKIEEHDSFIFLMRIRRITTDPNVYNTN